MGLVVGVRIADDGIDPDVLESLTRSLRAELLEYPVDGVESDPDGADLPAGARAGELVALGQLIVKLPKTVAGLGTVVKGVIAWLARGQSAHAIELVIGGDKIVVADASTEEQTLLIKAWVRAHGLD